MASNTAIDADFGQWREAEGVWFRRAARVIAVDDADGAGRVLLLRGIDPAEPSRTWWFTPGGGLEPDETDRDAAARELFEETGVQVAVDDLVGPVARRSAAFSFLARPCRQDEVLFFARVDERVVSRTGWTAIEQESLAELRWRRLDDLATTDAVVYPPALGVLVRGLLADGWDGVTQLID